MPSDLSGQRSRPVELPCTGPACIRAFVRSAWQRSGIGKTTCKVREAF